jgi:hypothetical protein
MIVMFSLIGFLTCMKSEKILADFAEYRCFKELLIKEKHAEKRFYSLHKSCTELVYDETLTLIAATY